MQREVDHPLLVGGKRHAFGDLQAGVGLFAVVRGGVVAREHGEDFPKIAGIPYGKSGPDVSFPARGRAIEAWLVRGKCLVAAARRR
jgi:hypothetical protein